MSWEKGTHGKIAPWVWLQVRIFQFLEHFELPCSYYDLQQLQANTGLIRQLNLSPALTISSVKYITGFLLQKKIVEENQLPKFLPFYVAVSSRFKGPECQQQYTSVHLHSWCG